MASFLRRQSKSQASVAQTTEEHTSDAIFTHGSHHYAVEKAGNGSGPSFQETSGAPVETSSPLGYAAGGITVAFLNFSKMVGTGVYSTR